LPNITFNFDVNQLVATLETLGVKVAAASKPYLLHLYEVYVRQAVIAGYVNIFVSLVISIAFVIFSVKLSKTVSYYRGIDKDKDKYAIGHDLEVGFSTAGIIVFGVVALLVFTLGISYGISQILNPEYHAIQHLIEQITTVQPIVK